MKIRILAAVTASLFLVSCQSWETGGALKAAGDVLDGEGIVGDEEIKPRKPNTSHIPDEESAGGFLQIRGQ